MSSPALDTILADRNIALKALGQNPQLVDPMGSYLVLKLIQPEAKSYGGLVLPSQVTDKNRPMLAEVIKVGPGQRGMMRGEFIGVPIQPGDLVLVVKNTPYEINLHGEVFWVGFEGDCLGKIDKESLATLVLTEKGRLEAEAAEKAQQLVAEKGELVEALADGEIRKLDSGILIATAGAGG